MAAYLKEKKFLCNHTLNVTTTTTTTTLVAPWRTSKYVSASRHECLCVSLVCHCTSPLLHHILIVMKFLAHGVVLIERMRVIVEGRRIQDLNMERSRCGLIIVHVFNHVFSFCVDMFGSFIHPPLPSSLYICSTSNTIRLHKNKKALQSTMDCYHNNLFWNAP